MLCGGASRRMGRSKATLPFGREVMLTRILRLLEEVVQPLVVVAGRTQQLPEIPATARLIRDRVEQRGPLEGLYCGLSALREEADAAYVTACDVPLLRAEFVRYLVRELEGYDVAVPVRGEFHYPLAAVYRTSIVDVVSDMLERDQLRMISFYEEVGTRRVNVEDLQKVDPELHSLMNLNRPEDYQTALRLAGFV